MARLSTSMLLMSFSFLSLQVQALNGINQKALQAHVVSHAKAVSLEAAETGVLSGIIDEDAQDDAALMLAQTDAEMVKGDGDAPADESFHFAFDDSDDLDLKAPWEL